MSTCLRQPMQPIQKSYRFSFVTIHRLRMIPKDSLMGNAIHHFLNAKVRTDKEIFDECVVMLQDQIRVDESKMKNLLGKSFDYFKHLQR